MIAQPRLRILLIEDHPQEQEFLSDLLKARGHEVLAVDNGPAGLQQAAEQQPDLVLLDVMMPDMDGFTVCERLRADPATAEVPIIFVTALNDRRSRLRGLRAGADEFISKPIDTIELDTRIQTIARINRYRALLDERQRAVKALKAAHQAALEAARVKSEFLSVVSHELLTPLNGILGLAHILSMSVTDDDQRMSVRMLQKAGADLHAMVRDLLDYTSLDTGAIQLNEGVFAVAEIVELAAAGWAAQAEKKGLRLRSEIGGLPATVYGDGGQIRAIVGELIDNAIKFSPAGEIVVAAALAARVHEQAIVEISVRDGGRGIAADVQARLFTPFSRADSSNTRDTGGMGMGLAIARLRAMLLGGSLSLVSAPGQGSTFSLRVPLRTIE